MKVSKLSAFLFLSIIFAICLILSPVFAGEHPWDNNQKGGTNSDSTSIRIIDPNVITNPGNGGGISGTAIFWWYFIYDEITDGKSTATAPAAKIGSENGGNLNKAAAIR